MFGSALYRAFCLGAIFLVSEITSVIHENVSALFHHKESTVCYHKNGHVAFQQEVYLKTHWNVRKNKKNQKRKTGEKLESHKMKASTEYKSIKRNKP